MAGLPDRSSTTSVSSPADPPVADMGEVIVTARQWLDCYDRATVEVLARGRGLKVSRGVSKEHILGQLEPVLFDADNIAANLAKLSPTELQVLGFVKETGGRTTRAAILQQLTVRGLFGVDEAIDSLLRRALLLYPYEKARAEGTHRYGKLITHHRLWSPPQVLERVEVQPVEPPPDLVAPPPPEEGLLPGPREFLVDLYAAWRYVAINTVSPLRGGGIGRRHRNHLKEILSFAPTGGHRVEAEGGTAYDFMFHLLRGAGAVDNLEERLTTTARGVELFNQSTPALLHELLQVWIDLHSWSEFRRIPELMVLPGDLRGNSDLPTTDAVKRARRLLLEDLALLPRGEWISLPQFLEFVKRRHLEFLIPRQHPDSTRYRGFAEKGDVRSQRLLMPADWERVEGRFIRQVLTESLHWMGFVDLGSEAPPRRRESRCVSFRCTGLFRLALGLGGEEGEEGASPPELKLIVQPNFDLIAIHAGENLPALQRLERFAELLKVDKACSLRLTEASVERGLKSGLSLSDIVATLEQHSGAPLPQNVTYSLTNWAESFRMIRVHPDVTLLELPDTEALDAVVSSPRWGRLVVTRLSPTLALIDSDRADDLFVLLKRRGVDCRDLTYGAPPAGQFVLSGFEVSVPGKAVTPYTEYFLSAIAERVAGDPGPHVFRFTPERTRQAREAGFTLREIADFLRAGARDPVPTELLVTLKAWAGRYPAVTVEPVVLLSAADGKTIDELLRLPTLADMVIERVGDSRVLVPVSATDRLRELMEHLRLEVTWSHGTGNDRKE